jgi:hypothetical protein
VILRIVRVGRPMARPAGRGRRAWRRLGRFTFPLHLLLLPVAFLFAYFQSAVARAQARFVRRHGLG